MDGSRAPAWAGWSYDFMDSRYDQRLDRQFARHQARARRLAHGTPPSPESMPFLEPVAQQPAIIPPHSRFHPVPTQNVFAPRPEYEPPRPMLMQEPTPRPKCISRPVEPPAWPDLDKAVPPQPLPLEELSPLPHGMGGKMKTDPDAPPPLPAMEEPPRSKSMTKSQPKGWVPRKRSAAGLQPTKTKPVFKKVSPPPATEVLPPPVTDAPPPLPPDALP